LKRWDEALASFDRFLERGGRADVELFRKRAAARNRTGEPVAALDDLTRALAIKPDSSLLAERGWLYLRADAMQLAVCDFTDAILQDPGNARAYEGRAVARIKAGQFDGAAEDTRKWLEKLPRPTSLQYLKAACIHALVVGRLDAESLSDAEIGKKRLEQQDLALQRLREALEAVPAADRAAFWDTYVRNDPDLRPVTRSREYQKLAYEYGRPLQ